MHETKNDILSRLKTEILSLEGLPAPKEADHRQLGLAAMRSSFPHGTFPLAAIHEFVTSNAETTAASAGFINAILGSLLKSSGTALWIGPGRQIFPPALLQFNIRPESIIFIDLTKEKDIRWAMEEGLKCDGLTAVIGELKDLDFTTSRRFQLAVEKSRVTGFVLRPELKTFHANASVSRWRIRPLPSVNDHSLPGIGFPSWHVELLKIRNGKPGEWPLVWAAGEWQLLAPAVDSIPFQEKRKTG